MHGCCYFQLACAGDAASYRRSIYSVSSNARLVYIRRRMHCCMRIH